MPAYYIPLYVKIPEKERNALNIAKKIKEGEYYLSINERVKQDELMHLVTFLRHESLDFVKNRMKQAKYKDEEGYVKVIVKTDEDSEEYSLGYDLEGIILPETGKQDYGSVQKIEPIPLKIDGNKMYSPAAREQLRQIEKLTNSAEIKKLREAINKLRTYGLGFIDIKTGKDRSNGKAELAVDTANAMYNELTKFIKFCPVGPKLEEHFNSFKKEITNMLLLGEPVLMGDMDPNKTKLTNISVDVLKKHRAQYKVYLANIAIALIPVAGLIALIVKASHSYKTKGYAEGFFNETKGERTLKEVKKDIDDTPTPKVG